MLPSLTVAFLVGLLFGSLTPFFPVTLCGGLFILAIGLWWCECVQLIERNLGTALLTSLLCGVVYWTLVVPPPSPPDRLPPRHDQTLSTVTGRIVAPVQHGPGRVVALIEPEATSSPDHGAALPGVIRVTWREPDADVYWGDMVEIRARVHAPGGSWNPGGFDYAAYLQRQGVRAVATVTGPGALRIVASRETAWRWQMWGCLDRWRARIRHAAINTLAQPALGVFLGITIGDRGYLQEGVQDWFMATGTVHLLSISGSHLGLVAVLVFALARRICLRLPADFLLAMSRIIIPTRVAVLCAWPTVLLYALLAGAELATIRSLVMITIALAVVWLGYERRLYHALAAAAMVILLHDPRAMFDLSFQLSFLSMIAIVHLIDRRAGKGDTTEMQPIRQRVTSWATDALTVSGAVMLVTLPLVAAYFNQVPWMGIVTNIAAIPLTGFLLVPIGLFSAIGALVIGGEMLPLGFIEERLIGWMVNGLHWCAELAFSEWRVPAPSFLSMGLYYLALTLVGVRGMSRVVRGCGAALIVLLLAWWVWLPRFGIDGDRWRVTFLDVGQGDSAVVELPDGRTILIDGGARYERFDMGRGVVAPFLWNRNIRHIDHVIGTHQQLDHVGGLVWVLRHFSVGTFWGTNIDRDELFAVELKDALRDRQLMAQIAAQGDELLGSGSCQLVIVNPKPAHDGALSALSFSGPYLNNQSIVSRLECGTQSVLFTADVEGDGLRRLAEEGRRPVTLVKVPHHGARSSLDREWIGEIRPRYAVVSVGAQNPYGHPAQPVLEAYAEAEIPLYRTDRDGAVWMTGRISTSEIEMHRLRDRMLRPTEPGWHLWRGESDNWHRIWLQLRDETAL